MHLLKHIVALIIWSLICKPLAAQIIDTTHTADYLVNEILLGNGVLVGNVKFTGEKHAIGIYIDSTNHVGVKQGIVLTSGNALYVLGPNKTPRSGWASDAPGDEELDKIARGKTYDASILEFEFVTASENLSFEFVFGSEEYLEYVGSKFNDVFAFFVDGPGLDNVNIAKLPDQVTPITVNTVNNELNEQYYIDNSYTNVSEPFIWDVRNRKVIQNKNYLKEEIPPKYDIQFDGFTTVLTAKCTVVPNKVYRIKIAISDVGDGILDSGVFLNGGSFSSYGEEVVKLDDHFRDRVQLKRIARVLPDPGLEGFKLSTEIPKIQLLGRAEFEFDKHVLTSTSKNSIKEVYDFWKKYDSYKITIFGHTDHMGSHEYNLDLAAKRAQSAADELMALGVPSDKLIVKSFGESDPVHTNTTKFGRARNRRVEFLLQP